MKKTALLNAQLSHLVATLGHGDAVVLADAGLPVPPGCACIDLAVTRDVPRLRDVLQALLSEMQVERAEVAQELAERNAPFLDALRAQLAGVPITAISHEDLKARCSRARAVVRTGEFTPYANIVLVAGVAF